jgi:hypothetical protein
LCTADALCAALIEKLNVVLAERQLLAELERSPRTTESIQCRFAFGDFCSARIVDQILDDLVCGSGIDSVLRLSRNKFPLQRFLRPISGTIGECINAPAVVLGAVVSVARRKRLPIVDGGRCEETARFRSAS